MVVGNISVGGVGKTPLTIHLVKTLQKHNIFVGVILRGYKGSVTTPMICNKNSDVKMVGDEAILYANCDIPVCVFSNRYLAGLELLKNYPSLDMIIMDDGLQHYALKRDYEIVVIDTTRYFGNKFVLPNGPLRETVSRVKMADVLVLNGDSQQSNDLDNIKIPIIYQNLAINKIYNPKLDYYYSIEELNTMKITVMVAMGNPERFCQFLIKNGINITNKLFYADHYYYQEQDIPNNSDIILVTSKDYTKLKQYNNSKIVIVTIDVILSNNYLENILINIKNK